MEVLDILNNILALITGLFGLVAAGITAYFALKNFAQGLKDKNKKEIWAMIRTLADAAMKEAEESGKSGADKKQMVIDIVKSSLKAVDVDIDDFIDQLDSYIDQMIKFVNDMEEKEVEKC